MTVNPRDEAGHLAGTPILSVVLPVLDEARDLRRLLDDIGAQRAPAGGFEVIVADGGSTDGTREIVREMMGGVPDLRLLENPGRLSSAGRNVGARAARGRYVLFLDGHCQLPHQDLFVRTVELFELTGADCLARPQPLDRLRDAGWGEAISKARHSWLGHDAGSDIFSRREGPTDPRSAGAAYRRSCIEELGWYDERFDACEDVEFNHRVFAAGKRAYVHPDLAVHYRPRTSLDGLFRQMFRYGRGRGRLLLRHGVWPKPLVALSLGVIAVLLVTLAVGPGAGTWLLAAGVSAWSLVALVESARIAGSVALVPKIALSFGAIFGGLLLGFWRGLLDFRRFAR